MTEDTSLTVEDRLSDQGYHIVGEHSAVKTCHWTKKGVRDEGQCYKNDFYGIQSHRCVQMTPLVTSCTQSCLFCWRDQSLDHEPEWDDPETVADGALEAHRDLVVGFKGSPDVAPPELVEEALDPKHVALSLAGEPPLYPHLPGLLDEFHDRGLTTFLVTNGTRPDAVRRVDPTQLYLSLDAADEQGYEELCRPEEDDLWEKVRESLDVLAEKDCRTAVRITLVKGFNDDPAAFAPLVERADPDFVEVKAYMHVGHSRERLDRGRMPSHDEVMAFSEALADELDTHDPRDDVPPSRVALLATDGDTRLQGV